MTRFQEREASVRKGYQLGGKRDKGGTTLIRIFVLCCCSIFPLEPAQVVHVLPYISAVNFSDVLSLVSGGLPVA
jgi:hypothetical protein